MPKLISDSRYKKLLEDQKKLRLLETTEQNIKDRTVLSSENDKRAIEVIHQRLAILELAVIQLARVINPSVVDVEGALRTAEKFGKPKTMSAGPGKDESHAG